jgi:hypothetical protein
MLPVGQCPTVGLGGLSAGAGFGFLSRWRGVTIDAISEVQLVTPIHGVVQASANHHPDLFWAARGGGGSAGVTTSVTLQGFRVSSVASVDLHFEWEAAEEALVAFTRTMAAAPRELDLSFKIRTTGADRYMDTSRNGPSGCRPGTPFVTVDGEFLGPEDEARDLVAPLLAVPGVKSRHIRTETVGEAVTDEEPLPILTDPSPADLRPMRVASNFARHSLARSASVIVDALSELQTAPEHCGGSVLIEPADGAIGDVPSDATAFPHRQADLIIEWEIFLSGDDSDRLRGDRWLAEVRGGLADHLLPGRYLNYGDLLDGPEDFWLDNLEQLRSVSAAADPQGILVTKLRPPAQATDA